MKKEEKDMNEDKIAHVREILFRIEATFKERFDRIDAEQKKQDEKIDAAENRITIVEKNNAVTRREIILYVTIGTFTLLQILEKINII